MSGVLRWETPPPRTRARIDWRAVARDLRAHPGEWAVIYEAPNDGAASTVMADVRNGRRAAMTPARDFETERRGRVVWARWIGDDENRADGESLAEFERDVRRTRVRELASFGLSTSEIAGRVGLSGRTVQRLRGEAAS